MESVANPWGQPPSARLDWAKGLPFQVRTVADVAGRRRADSLEVLYWVGCAAAFDDRNRRVARAVATCLDAAGVSFAVLGQEESCTGDPARRMGNEYVFQILAGQNVETLNRYRMGERTIVTACPHCFNTIGNEYGQLGGSFTIRHHSAVPVRAGRGRPSAARRRRAAGQDGHVPRLVLPGPLQRRDRPAARGPGRDPWRRAAGDGEQRQADVLLRGRRRPDVDGGDRAARASTPRARSRCWRRARRRWRRPARSAW